MLNFIFLTIFFILVGAFVAAVLTPLWLILFNIKYKIDAKNNKYSAFQMKLHGNIIFTLIIGLLLIIAITPISETLTCDTNYMCTIQTKMFVPFIKKEETFKINHSSYLGAVEKIRYQTSRSTRHRRNFNNAIKTHYYAIYNTTKRNPQIFKEPINEYTDGIYIQKITNLDAPGPKINNHHSAEFESYKTHPENGYFLASDKDRTQLNVRLFMWSLLMIIIMLWNLRKDRQDEINNVINFIKSQKTE